MTTVDVSRPIDLSMTVVGGGAGVLKPGRHDLSDEEMALWFVPGLIQSGIIKIVAGQSGEGAKSQEELNYNIPRIVLGENGAVSSKTGETPDGAPGGEQEEVVPDLPPDGNLEGGGPESEGVGTEEIGPVKVAVPKPSVGAATSTKPSIKKPSLKRIGPKKGKG